MVLSMNDIYCEECNRLLFGTEIKIGWGYCPKCHLGTHFDFSEVENESGRDGLERIRPHGVTRHQSYHTGLPKKKKRVSGHKTRQGKASLPRKKRDGMDGG